MSNRVNKEEFEELWESLTVERLEQVHESFDETEEAQRLSAEEREAYLRLKDGLPEELKPALTAYSNVVQNILYQKGDFFYRKGFGDAFLCMQLWIGDKKGMNVNVKIL